MNRIEDLIVGLVIGALLMFSVMFKGCSSCKGGETLIKADTVTHFIHATDTLYRTINVAQSVPYKIYGHDTVYVHHTETIHNHDTINNLLFTFSTDTAIYSDSIRQENEFKAILIDTLFNNRITGRQIKWVNLAPTKVENITKMIEKKQSLVKVFLGAGFTFPVANIASSRFDVSTGLGLLISDKIMVNADYGIVGQQINLGAKVKLSFKK